MANLLFILATSSVISLMFLQVGLAKTVQHALKCVWHWQSVFFISRCNKTGSALTETLHIPYNQSNTQHRLANIILFKTNYKPVDVDAELVDHEQVVGLRHN